MRLAYFSPLPPTKSGIADYSNELLPHLADIAEISIFADQLESLAPDLRERHTVERVSDYPSKRRGFDITLYHMGNNVHHETIYRCALRYPGLVVLHDLFLHHFVGHMTFVQGDYGSYARELGYALGSEGLSLYSDIRLGRRRFPVFDLPLCNRIIDRSLGLIVHSKTTAATIQTIRPDRPARVIPALIAPLEGHSLRKSLGYPEDTVVFASLGFVNVTKQIELALRAFARLHQEYPNSAYIIVGEIQGDIDLTRLVVELGLENCVKLTGYVQDLPSFLDWTATADVVINLRNPTLGETSAAALRAMAAGKPIIVFDHGWYGELSEEVCRKVPPMDSEALLAAMHDLARDSELRRRMGENAQLAVRKDHNPRKVAEAYIDFTKSVLAENNRRLIRW